MTYNTQYKAIREAFFACGITSKSKTHQGRGSAVRLAELLGVPEFDLRALARWNVTAMEGCYLSRLPRKAMRALAGFHPEQNNYFLPRNIDVPITLQSQIFSDVEKHEEAWKSKEYEDRDLATAGFLKLLKYLRTVLLQDSIFLMDLYPELEIWKSKVFQNEEYFRWKENAVKEVEEIQPPKDLVLQQAMPYLSQKMDDQHHEVIQRVTKHYHELFAKAKETQSMLQQICDGRAHVSVRVDFPHINSDGVSTPVASFDNNGNTVTSGTCETNITPTHTRMSRGVVSVRRLWLEWSVGLEGKLPICEMEEKFGTSWRKKPSESKYFRRRKKIIDAIIARSFQMDDVEESLDFFTKAQGTKTLDWLSKHIDLLQQEENEQTVMI